VTARISWDTPDTQRWLADLSAWIDATRTPITEAAALYGVGYDALRKALWHWRQETSTPAQVLPIRSHGCVPRSAPAHDGTIVKPALDETVPLAPRDKGDAKTDLRKAVAMLKMHLAHLDQDGAR
jgi:hypothetical protein